MTFGGYLKEIHVEVDPSRLLAHDLTLADVTDALEQVEPERRRRLPLARRSGADDPRRRLRQTARRTCRRSCSRATTARRSRVGDVARVVLSHTPRRGAVGYNLEGEVAEGFALLRRGENPSACSTACTRRSRS